MREFSCFWLCPVGRLFGQSLLFVIMAPDMVSFYTFLGELTKFSTLF